MYDINDPYDDEERQRALEALGTTSMEDPQAPDDSAAIQALAKESDRTSMPPQGSRVASQSAPENTPVQEGDDSGPGLNGWAVAADLVFNRGRGLGGIISMAEQEKRDYIKAKASGKDRSQELALRQRGLDLQQHGQEISEQALNARAAANTGKAEQSGKDRDGMLARIREFDPKAADDLADASPTVIRSFMTQFNVEHKLGMKEELNKAAAERAGGVKQEVLNVEHENVDRTAGDKGQISGAQAAARLPSQKAGKAAPNYEQSINAAGGMTPEQERAAAEEFTNKTAKQQKIAHSLQNIDDIMKRYPQGGVPGLGAAASVTPDWVRGLERAYDNARGNQGAVKKDDEGQTVSDALANMAKAVLSDESGQVFRPSEEQATKIRTGSGLGRTEEQAKEAIRLIREINNGSLASHGVGREAVARKVLSAAGLDPEIIKTTTTTGAPAAAAPEAGSSTRDSGGLLNLDDDQDLLNLGVRKVRR
jgi:hypothetical protein